MKRCIQEMHSNLWVLWGTQVFSHVIIWFKPNIASRKLLSPNKFRNMLILMILSRTSKLYLIWMLAPTTHNVLDGLKRSSQKVWQWFNEFDSVKSQDLTNPVSMALMSCDSTVADCPHKTLYSLPGLFAQKGVGACCHRGNYSICAKWHPLKINNGIVALPCSMGKLSINGYGQLHFQVGLL